MRKTTTKSLKRKLWQVFSLWVRERDKHKCVCCGNPASDAGHFAHMGKGNRMFCIPELDEANVNAQCRKCNHFLSGNLYVYGKYLERKYGEKMIKRIQAEKTKPHKVSDQTLKDLIERYDIGNS